MNQPPWGAPPTLLDQYMQQGAPPVPYGAYLHGGQPHPMVTTAWAAGDTLVVPLFGAQLPPICPKSGEPTNDTLLLKLAWQPQWVYFLLLLGVLPFAIASLATQKRAQILFPMSQRFIARRRAGFVVGITGFVLFLTMLIGGVLAGVPPVCFVSLFVFLGSLFYMVFAINLFKVVKITDHYALLRGVSPAYLQHVPQGPLPPG